MPSIYFRFNSRTLSQPLRSPVLERWLNSAEQARHVVDWRRDAIQHLIDDPRLRQLPAPAPAALLSWLGAQATHLAGRYALIATPVQARASLTSVSLPHDGVLRLAAAESQALAEDFNARMEHSGAMLLAGPAGELFCIVDVQIEADTFEPETVRGYDVWEFQPQGRDAGRLKKIASEIEMWLFDHELNRGRRAQGQPEITGLWLWGGGRIVEALPERAVEFDGLDVLYSAWAELCPLAGPAAGRIIRCLDEPGSVRFETLMSELRHARCDRLYLSCGSRCFTVRRMRRAFAFRRPKPWWDHCQEAD